MSRMSPQPRCRPAASRTPRAGRRSIAIETSGLRRRLAELAEQSGGDIDSARREFADTFRIPSGRPGTAAEVAELVAFLASNRARYITGTVQVIDGG